MDVARPSLKPADAWRIAITRTAESQFRTAHPDVVNVKQQLRELIADMIADGKVSRDRKGYWKFGMRGIYIGISGDERALVSYQTMHEYRTWSQIKAGVPSPVKGASESRRREKRKQRRLAELKAAVAELDGSVVMLDDEVVEVTGPKGTGRTDRRELIRTVASRRAAYEDLAKQTGLTGLRDVCAEPERAEAAWLAID